MNKVINVTLVGGLIGLLANSPHNALNRAIKRENVQGWRVVQVIPSASGNILLWILRIFLLFITLLLFTTANGYYVILERSAMPPGTQIAETTPTCSKCGNNVKAEDAFCEHCGNTLR